MSLYAVSVIFFHKFLKFLFTLCFQMLPSKPDYLTNAYKRLTSRDTNLFWTSGQWMTEKGGGSDVGKYFKMSSDVLTAIYVKAFVNFSLC